MHKYPRTRHLEGSRLQPGDEGMGDVPFAELAGRHLVVEEKCDGANAAVSFADDGALLLQSRGHYLVGGGRERHFDLFKTWAACHQRALHDVLGRRYVLFGEWAYAKHTIYYDLLPHYFLEFDVLDKERSEFLATPRRAALLAGLPLASVPVLAERTFASVADLTGLVGRCRWKSSRWRERLDESCRSLSLDAARALEETDRSDDMEGLYIKVEEDGRVAGRYKYVRASFLTCVLDSGSHWLSRPIVPNRLADGVDLFALP